MSHTYATQLTWAGSTGVGYAGYDRGHAVHAAGTELALSADAAFGGDPARVNPEQLLLAAASSCQLLSFLAVAAIAGVDVVAYADDAQAVMPADAQPARITRILLRPRVTVTAGTDVNRVRELLDRAHEQCYVANTLNAEVVLEPEVVVQ